MTTVLHSDKKALRTALWLAQVVVAFVFFVSGISKTLLPLDELGRSFAWTLDYPGAFIRFIGLCEIAGGLGLVLPAGTRIRPAVTPLAAACLALVMVYAAMLHISRGELQMLPVTLILFGACMFIMLGRARYAPIAARPLVGSTWETAPPRERRRRRRMLG